MRTPEDITMVKSTIHNPNEIRHFMQVVPVAKERTASVGNASIARSTGALVVKEVGLNIYDPVTYFPRTDVNMEALVRVDKTTHCPLKGNTEYFDVLVDGHRIPEAAWSYAETIKEAAQLNGLVAFDASKVDIS